MSSSSELFVVIGDVHGQVALALKALLRIEQEQGRRIAQMFSVGDFGLFLSERDWDFFTGPARHKHPDWSPAMRDAWTRWPWPLAMIGGNHEPWHKLRVFDSGYFGEKLSYTNGGVLPHSLSGLIVVGLSGIQRKSEETHSAVPTWQETLAQCQARKIGRRALTYYGPEDVTAAANAGPAHILLTHDWPTDPEKDDACPARVEQSIASAVRPIFHFCGHHHRSAAFATAGTEVRALNIFGSNANQNRLEPGWAWLGTWGEGTLCEIGFWPQETTKA
jgi:hypothetical protein